MAARSRRVPTKKSAQLDENLRSAAQIQNFMNFTDLTDIKTKKKPAANGKPAVYAPQILKDVAKSLKEIQNVVSQYNQGNTGFVSPYISILQYETKLNIMKQTMAQLRQNYKLDYHQLKTEYERNPSDKIEVYKRAIIVKDLIDEYAKLVLDYILHEQLIQKFWDAVANGSDTKEKEYATYMRKTYAPANDAAKRNAQAEYAALYAEALSQKIYIHDLYPLFKTQARRVTDLSKPKAKGVAGFNGYIMKGEPAVAHYRDRRKRYFGNGTKLPA